MLGQLVLEGPRGILGALIVVKNQSSRLRLFFPDRLLQCIDHQILPHGGGHGPTNHSPSEDIQDNGQEEKALLGGDVGDVAHPELMGRAGFKNPTNAIEPRIVARHATR